MALNPARGGGGGAREGIEVAAVAVAAVVGVGRGLAVVEAAITIYRLVSFLNFLTVLILTSILIC